MGKSKGEPEPLPESRKLEIVHSAIRLIESRIQKKEITSSMADLIRLLEMETELASRGAVREIRATWVEPDQPTVEEAEEPKPEGR